MQKFYKFNARCSCNLKQKLLRKKVHDEQKIMPIRSKIVNTSIFHYFKRKIAIYVTNFTKNPNIFKIERDENIL